MPDHPVVRAVATGDPSVAAVESERTRRALGFPPFRALAVVHGESAPDYVETLRTEPELSVIGPDGGRFLVRAADHTRLCDALARHTRPGGGTVRVAVDPRRY
jgi:hypothetical protein